jgi:inhibitor of cysteine peptidase
MAWKPLLTTLPTVLLAVGLAHGPVMASSDDGPAGMADATTVSVDCDAFAAEPSAVPRVAVAPGASVVLSLCSNPSTGYRWTDPVSSDPTVASVGGWAYVAAERDLPGASGTEDLTIVAVAPGTAVISASYDQPWEGGAKGDWTVKLTVEVIKATTLSISCDEFEASPAAVRSVDLAAGTSLVLSLCSNPTTGFRWSEPVSSDPAIASVNGWEFEAPEAAEGMTGAPGMEHVTVLTGAAGSAAISSSYDQPWDGGQKGAWTLDLTVVVE